MEIIAKKCGAVINFLYPSLAKKAIKHLEDQKRKVLIIDSFGPSLTPKPIKHLKDSHINASEALRQLGLAFNKIQLQASDFDNGLRRYYAVPNQKLAMKPKKKPPTFARFQNDFSDRRSYKKL